ncbi:MAG: alpha-xenorhabdolysin family binary toxin subunit A [Actinomycetota bacterium]|nr:alpha-xenorhabdolysin family binary toxin subunit A [Actinomycetota bacterium]MDQ2955480.1 alpha-xenorhabdolysin family binary toxin subunit A [Actinomycetota bacterium]
MSTLSIGPSTIADPGTDGGPAFTLSGTEWVAIQTYVTDALALPTTDQAFRNSLGSGAPADLSDFTKLIDAYAGINTHVTNWEKNIYPATVALASDVYQYGTNKAPVFYPPILKEADILEKNPDDQHAKDALKAILDNLKADAQSRADKAAVVASQIQDFAGETQADKSILIGPNGDAGLVKYYDDKYGSTSQEVMDLTKEIDAQRLILKAADDEYNHDVVVAATSPTYAWIWPVGTIAAAVVAGIYGDKAVKALDRARAAQAKINTLTDKLTADANMLVAIHSAEIGMNTIVGRLSAALPVIQKIQGVWGGMSADLAAISSMIDTDIRNVPPIIMSLGVDESITAWHNVALAANNYRVNAYVTQQGGAAQSMAAWKVQNQFSSARRLVRSAA